VFKHQKMVWRTIKQPWSKTKIRSQSITLWRRWAIVRIVHSANLERIVFWINSSVFGSTC
jgi:hypothetical protein